MYLNATFFAVWPLTRLVDLNLFFFIVQILTLHVWPLTRLVDLNNSSIDETIDNVKSGLSET